MNPDETIVDSTSPTVLYEAYKSGAEVVDEVVAALIAKAAQWNDTAAFELTKKAGDRAAAGAYQWAADQLQAIASAINAMPLTVQREAPATAIPRDVDEMLDDAYDAGFTAGEEEARTMASEAFTHMFTQDEVDSAVEAAIEAYERNRPVEPFIPNPEILNSNAEPSGEAPEPGVVAVDSGNIVEIVEPGSEDDPFITGEPNVNVVVPPEDDEDIVEEEAPTKRRGRPRKNA